MNPLYEYIPELCRSHIAIYKIILILICMKCIHVMPQLQLLVLVPIYMKNMTVKGIYELKAI